MWLELLSVLFFGLTMAGMPAAGCCCDPECACCIDGTQPAAYRVTITGVVEGDCGGCSNWNASFDVEQSGPVGEADGCFDYVLDLSEADPPICGPAPSISIAIDCQEYTLVNLLFQSGEVAAFAQSNYVPEAEGIQEPIDCFEEDMPFGSFFQSGAMGCDFSGASATITPL